MKNNIIGSLFCLLSTTLWSQTSPTSFPDSVGLATLLKEHQVPGLAFGLFENNKLAGTFYLGTGQEGQAIGQHTLFNTASLTKSLTAYLTLQLILVEEQPLDEPLHRYWIDPDVAEDDRHQMLTPHLLLTHQGGFANWRWMEEGGQLRFQFAPGTQFGYSGEGYEYLRRALEVKYQQDFRTLAQRYVFAPLSMERTYLSWQPNLATNQYAGEFDATGQAYEVTKTEPNAADDLITTLADLGHFCESVLGSLPNQKEFYSSQVSPRPGLTFTHGWVRMNDLPNGEYALLSAGSDQGVNALMVLLPESGRGMIALTNGDGGRAVVMKLLAATLGDAGEEILSRF